LDLGSKKILTNLFMATNGNGNKKGYVLWFTGFSAAGKSTLADRVVELLNHNGNQLERLDGDEVRKNLTNDLGFSKEDRDENIRRIGFVAELLSRNNVGVIASFISPYRKQRQGLRDMVTNYIEIFVDAPLAVCEARDPKGMYKKARAGEIKQFTGIDDPYEPPENPEIHVKTDELSVEECAQLVLQYLRENGYIG
jgi:adenylyl-sulfate kinase